MINVVCTSKPCDGLLYYSYEYASLLDAKLIIIPNPKFTEQDYLNSIQHKYIHCKNVEFDYYGGNDITLIMGRSMLTLVYRDFKNYSDDAKMSLIELFRNQLISVYSNNHPNEYSLALEFFKPSQVTDLCDHEVYPDGVGENFIKRINFDIYKEPVEDVQFEHLFLGTNDEYYQAALDNMKPDSRILVYKYVNEKSLVVPVDNILGMFNTYVYTKPSFDPAPRLLQESMYFSKKVCYNRDKNMKDGGSVYFNRKIEKPSIEVIQNVAKTIR